MTLRRGDGKPRGCGPSLVGRVDDLYSPILSRKRLSRILQVGFSIADRHHVPNLDAVLLQQKTLDRIGAAFGETLIIGLAALRWVGPSRRPPGSAGRPWFPSQA